MNIVDILQQIYCKICDILDAVVGETPALPFGQTVTLNAVDDIFPNPAGSAPMDLNFETLSVVLEQGTHDISYDGGATYPQQITVIGQTQTFGVNNIDLSQVVFQAKTADTRINFIGSYYP